MKSQINSLLSLLIIGFFVFCLLDSNTQFKVAKKFEILISLKEGTLTNFLSNEGGGEIQTSKKLRSKETMEYYEEIVMNDEFGSKRSEELKWTSDMKIYVQGENVYYLIDELTDIVSDLNEIIDPINIKVVDNPSEANMFIYLGSGDGFLNAHPDINPARVKKHRGYFKVEYNKGKMYVDIHRTNEIEQKHLLREELTQSLGLLNDSYKYPESIFYQGWTTTTEYAEIDKELIDMLYNN